MRKQINAFLIEVYILTLLVIFVSVFYLSQKMISLFFDADMLYLPILFQDLFYQGGNYIDWNLTPVPYFFPDWLVFFIAFSLTKKIYFQFLIISCINVLIFYLAIRLIYQEFFSKNKAILFSLTSISCFLFLSTYISQFHDELIVTLTQPYRAVYLPTMHVGGFTVGLFYIWIQLRLFSQKEINTISWFLFFAVLISLAAGMSDLLYIIQFTLPVFISYIFLLKRQINWNNILIFSLMPLLFSMLGGWLIKYIVHGSTLWSYLGHPSIFISKFSFSFIKNVFNFFIVGFFNKVSPLISLVFVVFYLGVIYIFICSNCKKYIENKFYILDNKMIFFNCFILFSILITILSTGFGRPAVRYIYPFFYFPILSFFYIACFLKNKKKISDYLCYLSVLVLVFFVFLFIKLCFSDSIKLQKDYYPDDIHCIDNALRTEGHRGISDYWQAFPISMLSRDNITVLPIQRDLWPFNFIANRKWFNNKYSFVIFYKNSPSMLKLSLLIPDENLIRKINGEPKKIVFCGDKKLLIYPKNALRTAYFVNTGDEVTWLASELPSRFPKSIVQDQDARQVKAEDGIGFVTFGPGISLTAGKYHVYITYASNAPTSKQVGFWDVFAIKRGLIFSTEIFGTNSKQGQMEGVFEVPSNLSEDSYHIRTYSSAQSNLIIKSIKIIKL